MDLLATSPDLITWTKSPTVLVAPGEIGAIDDWHAHKPAVIRTGDRLEHYYCAVQRLPTPADIGGYRQPEMRGIALAWSPIPPEACPSAG